MNILTSLTLGLLLGMRTLAATSEVAPVLLRCEYLENPLGVDVAQPRLSWKLEVGDQRSVVRGRKQTAYQLLVASTPELLANDQGDLWDGGKVDSKQNAHVAYSGKTLTSGMDCWWKVRIWDEGGQVSGWSRHSRWSMGLLNATDWSARWIGVKHPTAKPAPAAGAKSYDLPPLPYFRKPFTVDKPVARATIYATALGCYELHLNGHRVGEDYFNPGWSEFRKRVYYHAYDVTALLQPNANVLGAILADGWYSGYIWAGRNNYGPEPRLLTQLLIEYADGTKQTVGTDGSWKWSYGPLLEGDIQQGETYDARLELPGWDAPCFDESKWQAPDAVIAAEGIPVKIEATPNVTVRRQQEWRPIKMTEPRKGTYIFNLGQNIAGWARLKVKGPAGSKVTVRVAGMLNPDGTLYTDYLRDARATDAYILKGAATEETWEPRFTYHGFQYVELTGYPGVPDLESVTGVACNSQVATVGTFECSDPRINQLYANILATMRGNLVDIPTGDADRAERLGWCAKGPLVQTWMYTLDMGAFLTKWMVDLTDAQSLSTGKNAFLQVAPFWGDVESPGWSDDGIWVPYGLYRAYGDTGIIAKHYDAMARYIEYIRGKLVDDLRPAELGQASDPKFPGYGDWLSINYDAAKHNDIINTILNGHSVKMMAEMAAAVGRTDDAIKFRELFDRMKAAFNRAYVSEQGEIRDKTQTEYALALYCGFLNEDKIPAAIKYLVEDIQTKEHQVTTWGDALGKNPMVPPGHLTTGFHGSRALLPVLSRYGRNDAAYELLMVDSYPSWLYPVKLGATSLWERWDSWTPEKGFQNPAMNSFHMPDLMASVAEWLFAYVGGIGQEGSGFNNIVIKPYVGQGLTYAKATYHSINGEIAVHWEKKSDGSFEMRVTVPVNTTAKIGVPAAGRESVRILEGETIVWEKNAPGKFPAGIASAAADGQWVVIGAGSGTYRFTVKE